MPQLVFSRDKRPLFRVRLQASSTKIGRSQSCDVVLGDPEISRQHATIFAVEGQFLIKKQGNSALRVNGTEVDNHPLKDQDLLQIGSWVAQFQENPQEEEPTEVTHLSGSTDRKTQSVSKQLKGGEEAYGSLLVQQPSCAPCFYPLEAPVVMVGADDKNDLVLEDSYLSGRHLKIVCQDGQVWIYDLGSTNGTYLNGVKIREAQLDYGVVVKLGQCQLTLQREEKPQRTQEAGPTDRFGGLVGSAPVMQRLYANLKRVGPTEATALILGESGSGKELVARAVHQLSVRASGPFVALNCGAISKELIESELFGHEKGAFTGAARQHEGAFGQAKGGTLFLDEIGELPLDLQPKLLRVLENKTYRRVGAAEERIADVRVVAATHRDLTTLVKEKKFREDLFFRLFVLPVHVPALREHAQDIPLLVENFLQEFSVSGEPKRLSLAAVEKLQSHAYPGNVRELRNIIMRSVLLSKEEEIGKDEILFPENFIPVSEASSQETLSEIEKLADMERKLVLRALKIHDWNKAKAAESLGIAKSTLFSKIKIHNLNKEQEA